jgi:hypothetical protein
MRIVLEQRLATQLREVGFDRFVDLGGGDTRRNHSPSDLVSLPNGKTRLPHLRDFAFAFKVDQRS